MADVCQEDDVAYAEFCPPFHRWERGTVALAVPASSTYRELPLRLRNEVSQI
jgi:hypothetical protein